jgi:hypothetical protein
MANLFEKPIAANPMSEFVGLPMEFIDQAMQRKTEQFHKGKAEVAAQEASLLNLQYLAGDTQRHHELQGQYQQELDNIVESASGDYGNVQGALDVFTRRLKAETSPHGELGAQQSAFNTAMKMKEVEDKKLAEGKSSQEGYNKFLGTIGQHKTVEGSDGGFNSFQGYSSSTIVDPIKAIQDGVDEIKAQYDEEGTESVNSERISANALAKIKGNTNLYRALEERVYGKVDAKGNPVSADAYAQSVIAGVISDKEYEKKITRANADGSGKQSTAGQIFQKIGQPKYMQGNMTITGGSVPLLRDLGKKVLGVDSWREFEKNLNSPEGRARVDFIEWKTQTKMPTEIHEARNWLIENAGEGKVSQVQARGATPSEQANVDNEGVFNDQEAAVYDMEGNPLSGKDVNRIQGSSSTTDGGGKKTTKLTAIMLSGHPPGTKVIVSHDGNTYFQHPSDPKVINSLSYNRALLNMAKDSNTGIVTIQTHIPLGKLPKGTYEVEYMPGSGQNKISKNGKPVARSYMENGITYIDEL